MRRKWRWVTRGKGADYVDVWFGATKPLQDFRGRYFDNTLKVVTVCARDFMAATGIKIKPGQCLKVDFSAKIIEESRQ